MAVADAFRSTHAALAGGYEHQPYFDLLAVVDTLPQALPPYGGVLTPHRAKLEAYVRSVVRRFRTRYQVSRRTTSAAFLRPP